MPTYLRRISYFLILLGIGLAGFALYANPSSSTPLNSFLHYLLPAIFVALGSGYLFCQAQNPHRPILAWTSLFLFLGSIKWVTLPFGEIFQKSHALFRIQFSYFGHTTNFDWLLTLSLLIFFFGYVAWKFPKKEWQKFAQSESKISPVLSMTGLIWASLWITEMFLWLTRAWYDGTGQTFLYYHLLNLPVVCLYSILTIALFLLLHTLLLIGQGLPLNRIVRVALILAIPAVWAFVHLTLFDFWPFSLVITLIWIAQCGFNWTISLRQVNLQTFFYVVFFAAISGGMFSWFAADLYQKKQAQIRTLLIQNGSRKGQPDLEDRLATWQKQWRQDTLLLEAIQKDFLTTARVTTHLTRHYLEQQDSLARIDVLEDIPEFVVDKLNVISFYQSSYWIHLAGKWWLKYTAGPTTPTLESLLQKNQLGSRLSQHVIDSFYFAIWDTNQRKMIETRGLFPFFDRSFIELFRAEPKQPFSYKGYTVHIVPLDNNLQWIITSTQWARWDRLASFGGLFMLSIFQIVIIFLLLWLVLQARFIRHIGFSSRIQLFIQIAFLIPLFLLTFILYRLFDRGLAETQADSQIQVSQNIALGIQKSFQLWVEGKISQGKLAEDFRGISANREQPMALFDLQGKVILEDRLQNTSVPDQWAEKPIIREELGLGKRRNTAVIYPLVTRFNQPLGWLKLDFLEAPFQLDMRKRYLLRSIFIMFVSLFGLLFTTAYWMSTFLTEPLHVLSQRLLGLSLERSNELLPEDLPDEMGTLTRAYNQMLVKLEESKRALAQSEKQSAWQEVAKQVAHEIKNPLTPMKLQIQQMLRQIPVEPIEPTQLKMKQSLSQMIEKIDHLSDIAFSFSQFAELEIPQVVRFDLRQFLQEYQLKSISVLDFNANQLNELTDWWVLQDPGFVEKTLQQIELYFQEKKSNMTPIHISIHHSTYFAQIQVKKVGFELSEEEREKLFFPRITERSAQFGLAMAKKGIESTGGNLWFDQQPGQTNIFYLEIPLG